VRFVFPVKAAFPAPPARTGGHRNRKPPEAPSGSLPHGFRFTSGSGAVVRNGAAPGLRQRKGGSRERLKRRRLPVRTGGGFRCAPEARGRRPCPQLLQLLQLAQIARLPVASCARRRREEGYCASSQRSQANCAASLGFQWNAQR